MFLYRNSIVIIIIVIITIITIIIIKFSFGTYMVAWLRNRITVKT